MISYDHVSVRCTDIAMCSIILSRHVKGIRLTGIAEPYGIPKICGRNLEETES